jgi:hypothetical protein
VLRVGLDERQIYAPDAGCPKWALGDRVQRIDEEVERATAALARLDGPDRTLERAILRSIGEQRRDRGLEGSTQWIKHSPSRPI